MTIARLHALWFYTLAATVSLSGCSSSGSTTILDAQPAVSIAMPQTLRNLVDLDITQIRPLITLSNGTTLSMNRGTSGSTWEGTALLEADASYTATIIWKENYAGSGEIDLVRQTMVLHFDVLGNVRQSITSDNFTEYHDDNDGISNLQERLNGSNPKDGNNFDALETRSLSIANVIVPRIAVESAPLINSSNVSYDTNGWFSQEWAMAVQTDTSGAPLSIASTDSSTQTELDHQFRWAALHDGQYLYIAIAAEPGISPSTNQSLTVHFNHSSPLSSDVNSVVETRSSFGKTIHLTSNLLSTTQLDTASARSDRLLVATHPEGAAPDTYKARIRLDSVAVNTDRPVGFQLTVAPDKALPLQLSQAQTHVLSAHSTFLGVLLLE